MNEIDVFYDRFGAPKLRLLKSGRLVSFNGKSVGFVNGPHLYNYHGRHVGWLENGIMRDLNGNTVAFGQRPTDSPHPFLPFRQFKPFPNIVELEPLRPPRQLPNIKAIKGFGWSPILPISLFLGQGNG